jgi:hypothetical protein
VTVTPCPICTDDDYHTRTAEIVCHRIRHRVPELWLLGRERCHTGSPIERMSAARHDWIEVCEATRDHEET